jgi:hypothetical protein
VTEDVSKSYVDELGETNEPKTLKGQLASFAVYLVTWFRNADVCLLRQASATSAAGELPGRPRILRFAAYERVALFRLQTSGRASELH